MFGWFKKKPAENPPTQKQLNYAAKLGLSIKTGMSKYDVSDLIASAEAANPKLGRQREHVKDGQRLKKHGPELIAQEKRWNEFAEKTEFMLAIYRQGKDTVVDVLRVNEASIDDRGKLILGVEAPKLRKDRHIGEYLEWDRSFDLPSERLLHHEPLHSDFVGDGIPAYRRVVEKGLAIARKLATEH